jgi:hypothetical protein
MIANDPKGIADANDFSWWRRLAFYVWWRWQMRKVRR